MSRTHSNQKQALYRLIKILRCSLSWIAIVLIYAETSKKCRLFHFSKSSQLELEDENIPVSLRGEEKQQEIIDALNQRIERLLNETISLRCELHEMRSSRGRLKASVIDLNEIITINRHKFHSVSTQFKAEKRAVALLKERLTLLRGTERISSKKERESERKSKRAVQLNDHIELKSDDLKQRYERFDEHLANKVESEKISDCQSTQTTQQNSGINVAQFNSQNNRNDADQRETTHIIANNTGDDCVFHASTVQNDTIKNEEYQQSITSMINDSLCDAMPVHRVVGKDADIFNLSESVTHQSHSESHVSLLPSSESPKNRRKLDVRPEPALLVTVGEEISNENRSQTPICAIQRVDSHADENKKSGSIEQKERNTEMDNLFVLPKLTPSPSTSLLSPIDDLTTFMDAEAAHRDSVILEPYQFMPPGNLTSSCGFDQNNIMDCDPRQFGAQEEEDRKIFEPLTLNGFEGTCDIFPSEDVDMCGGNYSLEFEMEQNVNYITISTGESHLKPDPQLAAQFEIQSPTMLEDSKKFQTLYSNADQATETSMIPSYIPHSVDTVMARSGSRNDLIPNKDHQPPLLQKASDFCEVTDSEKASNVEKYEPDKSEDQPYPVKDKASDRDETDSLDYLFEGGPEDLRDLFPEAFDSTPDIVVPSGAQVAESDESPSQDEKLADDKCESDRTLNNNKTKANTISRRYRRSKPNPLACLRPNVPGWSFPRKQGNATESIVLVEAACRNSESEIFLRNLESNDSVENGRRTLINRETTLRNSDFNQITPECGFAINVAKKAEEITPQPDNLKRQRSIYEVDENTRVKKPDTSPDHQRSTSPGAKPLWMSDCHNLP